MIDRIFSIISQIFQYTYRILQIIFQKSSFICTIFALFKGFLHIAYQFSTGPKIRFFVFRRILKYHQLAAVSRT